MSEQMLEKLNEVERAGVEHLRQAQVLGVSLAEYCRSFDLDLGKWYRVKQVLTRKGIVVTGTSVAVAGEKPPEFARVKIVPPLAAVATAPIACRIVHPSGWIVECGSFPQADWLAAVLSGARR
jgi:hypothetical protein